MFWKKREGREKKEESLPDNELTNKLKELVEAGELDKALEIAEKIKDDKNKSIALLSVAEAYAKAGELDEALEPLRKLLSDVSEIVKV